MIADKELEQIKWEYLKRSDLYKEFCELKKTPNATFPDKFQPMQGDIFNINPLVLTYDKYGDVHHISFKKWFSSYYESYPDTCLGSVDELSGIEPGMKHFLRNTFIFIIERYKNISGGKEPSLLEMAELLRYQMRIENDFQSYLKIRQADFTVKEAKQLSNDVYKILKKRIPERRLRIEELKTYLYVYDSRKKGQSDKEIIKNIYRVNNWLDVEGKRTKEAKSDKELIDEINKYYKYAERLIKNAERDIYQDQNIFPGNYYKS